MIPWNYYKPGTEIKIANIRILDILVAGKSQDSTSYKIKYLCCDRKARNAKKKEKRKRYENRSIATIKHKGIGDKIRHERSECRFCSAESQTRARKLRRAMQAKQEKKPYGVIMPSWPKPPSIAGGHWYK